MKNEHRSPDFRDMEGLKELNAGNTQSINGFVEANRDKLGLGDDTSMHPCTVHCNNDGTRTASVTGTVELELKGPQYGIFSGAVVEIEEGATLAFDSAGVLTSLSKSTVDKKAMENTRATIEQYIQDGMIKFTDPSKKNLTEKDLFNSDGVPYKGYTVYEEGKMKIVRSPIFVFCHRQKP